MASVKLKTKRDIILPDIAQIKDQTTRQVLEKILKIMDEEHTDIYQDLQSVNGQL